MCIKLFFLVPLSFSSFASDPKLSDAVGRLSQHLHEHVPQIIEGNNE